LDAPDPEVDDGTDAEQLLAAGVAEVPARLGRNHAIHHLAAALPDTGRAFEACQAVLELGEPHVRGRIGHAGGRAGLAPSPRAASARPRADVDRFAHRRVPP